MANEKDTPKVEASQEKPKPDAGAPLTKLTKTEEGVAKDATTESVAGNEAYGDNTPPDAAPEDAAEAKRLWALDTPTTVAYRVGGSPLSYLNPDLVEDV